MGVRTNEVMILFFLFPFLLFYIRLHPSSPSLGFFALDGTIFFRVPVGDLAETYQEKKIPFFFWVSRFISAMILYVHNVHAFHVFACARLFPNRRNKVIAIP